MVDSSEEYALLSPIDETGERSIMEITITTDTGETIVYSNRDFDAEKKRRGNVLVFRERRTV